MGVFEAKFSAFVCTAEYVSVPGDCMVVTIRTSTTCTWQVFLPCNLLARLLHLQTHTHPPRPPLLCRQGSPLSLRLLVPQRSRPHIPLDRHRSLPRFLPPKVREGPCMHCNRFLPSFLGSSNRSGSGLDLFYVLNSHLVTGPTPVYPYCETCVTTNYYCKNTGGKDVDRFTMTCYTPSHF